MPGGDTITARTVEAPSRAELAWELVLRAVCRRWGHLWRPYGRPLHWGTRTYCSRCLTNRIAFPDGETVEATGTALKQGDPTFAEALYEARWGEKPRKVLRRGEWPAL
jgi:hypothetical protein